MISDEQHRAIGRILGFPSCCVEAWIAGLGSDPPQGVDRGCIMERYREPAEGVRLDAAVSSLLGRPWSACTRDPRKAYVPCAAHVGAPGWRP